MLVLEIRETLADSLIRHGGYPQTGDRTLSLRLLHHPALDELTLLSGVTTVDNALGLLHQTFDDGELLLDALVVNEFDAEALRNHGQRRQTPRLPRRCVVVRLFQGTQMTKGPRHLKAVALHIAVVARRGSDNPCDIPRHTGFLCDAYYHNECKGTKNH